MKRTKSDILKLYAKKRAELKRSFYSLKKQGFADGNYKDTIEYRAIVKSEKGALYRNRNRDKIRDSRKKARTEARDTFGLKTVTPVNSLPAYKAFSGGKNSAYFSVLSLLLPGRKFYGFIEIVRNGGGYPNEENLGFTINNPYFSVAGYFRKIRQIIDHIQNDTEKEYLFLTCIVSITYSYSKDKIIVTHIFDFTNVE